MSDFFADAGAWFDQAVQDTGEWIDQAVQDTGDALTGNSKAQDNDPVSDAIDPLTNLNSVSNHQINTYDPITNPNQASRYKFYRGLRRMHMANEMSGMHEMNGMNEEDLLRVIMMMEIHEMGHVGGFGNGYINSRDIKEEISQFLGNSMAAPSEVLA